MLWLNWPPWNKTAPDAKSRTLLECFRAKLHAGFKRPSMRCSASLPLATPSAQGSGLLPPLAKGMRASTRRRRSGTIIAMGQHEWWLGVVAAAPCDAAAAVAGSNNLWFVAKMIMVRAACLLLMLARTAALVATRPSSGTAKHWRYSTRPSSDAAKRWRSTHRPLGALQSSDEPTGSTAGWLGKLSLAGAALGPVCDNFHSGFDVLGYTRYQVAVGSAADWWGDGHLFQTAYWVPPLFALAAIIIGGIDEIVSSRLPNEERLARPSGGRVAAGVASFVALYGLSAYLAGAAPLGAAVAPGTSSLVLWPLALALWAAVDPSPSSFVSGAATAVGGPAIEIALLGAGGLFPEPFGHLYAYTNADLLGIDSWITAVYFAGGPAVALVSRFLRR